MLIGYNNDVEHRGKTFHIQTEDRGMNDDTIETQLFCGGAILDTNITSYTELVKGLEGKAREKKIKSIMQASHRSLFKKLMAGEYDAMVGLEPLKEPGSVDLEAVEFEPGRDGVPEAALAIEEGDIGAFAQDSAEGHVDLSQLKSKLASLGGEDEGSGGMAEESEGAATQVMEAPPEIEITDDTRQKLKARLARKSSPGLESLSEAQEVVVAVGKRGVKAWTGCREPEEDLSLTELVEAYLAG